MPFLRQIALQIPPVRRLYESRADALARADLAEEARAAANARHESAMVELREANRIAAHHQAQGAIAAMLNNASPGGFVHLALNGAPLDVPVETLRTMFHCIHFRPDGKLDLWVETMHLNWMMDRQAPGGTFLDVGASTGATALPTARRFGLDVRVIAYEPATDARGLLESAVSRNGLTERVNNNETAGLRD